MAPMDKSLRIPRQVSLFSYTECFLFLLYILFLTFFLSFQSVNAFPLQPLFRLQDASVVLSERLLIITWGMRLLA